jgi:hypothetical protein
MSNSDFSTAVRSTVQAIKRRRIWGLDAHHQRMHQRLNYKSIENIHVLQDRIFKLIRQCACYAKRWRSGGRCGGDWAPELKNLVNRRSLPNSCHILLNPIISANTTWNGIHHDSVVLGRLGQGTASTA